MSASRALLALALLAISSLALAQRALFGPEGGPIDPAGASFGTSAAECGACHEAEHRAWRATAHARAWVDPVFQAEHARGPSAFCVHCHAPRETADVVGPIGADGVDCATCHVRDGVVLTTHAVVTDAHPTRAEPRLGGVELCASCHDFAFPARSAGALADYFPGDPLQRSVSEWRASGERTECIGCHMPRGDHALRGLDDAAFVRDALDVRARATATSGGAQLTLTLAPRGIGHAFPTGDLFRRLRVTARTPEVARSRDLARVFAAVLDDDVRAFHLREVDDTRPTPGHAARVVLDLPGRTGAVAWSVDLFRLDPDVARERGLSDALVRVPVAAGTLSVGPAAR